MLHLALNLSTKTLTKKLPYGLSSYSGLAFVGKYLKRANANSKVGLF